MERGVREGETNRRERGEKMWGRGKSEGRGGGDTGEREKGEMEKWGGWERDMREQCSWRMWKERERGKSRKQEKSGDVMEGGIKGRQRARQGSEGQDRGVKRGREGREERKGEL